MSDVQPASLRRVYGHCEDILIWYSKCLKRRPVLTKAITSSLLLATSDVFSQMIVKWGKSKEFFEYRSTFAFALFGFVITGPATHYFYEYLEKYVPRKQYLGFVKKVIVDRLLFAPTYLFVLLYFIAILEGNSPRAALQKVRKIYWSSLIKNVIYWTIMQSVNMYYIPVDKQALYANVVSFVWNAYLSALRR